jgi:benzoyl-CoA reductase/2-hydroxyglutaryl-CoA dehydratase subunit BcrC/BadD/HgdB
MVEALMVETTTTTSETVYSRLDRRLSEEPDRIAKAKKNGAKVVGYFCPHVPEELILAAGMIPLRLAFGGDVSVASVGEEYLKPYSCPYARSCIGYRLDEKNEYYKLVDAICVAQTCENIKLVGEYWEKYFGVPVFSLGMLHTHDAFRSRPQAIEYFKREIDLLCQRLGQFAGKPIKHSDIRQAINLCNGIREKLHLFYDYPREYPTPISWYEVLRITQAGYLIDRHDYLNELKTIDSELGVKKTIGTKDSRPRLMIAGSIIGIGDHKVLDIVETVGGNIVADSVCTGSMFARKNVTIYGIAGSPIDALAERYLYNLPCPCMTDLNKRLNRLAKIGRDYQVAGLIYYNLKYCDTWRSEFPLIKEYLYRELAIPSLLVESDYSSSDVGTIRTKVEAFIEILGGFVK